MIPNTFIFTDGPFLAAQTGWAHNRVKAESAIACAVLIFIAASIKQKYLLRLAVVL